MSPAQAATGSGPTSANTLEVHADQPFRPVTHVATGSLYGLADATTPADGLVEPIKPNTFVQKPQGGKQQPTGGILTVAPEAARAGAKVVDRLSDLYAGWPYQFSWNTWLTLVDQQIAQVKASGITNLAAYAPWNESDNTWLSSNGTFEDFWTKTYREIRSKDATTPIQGPSFSDNIGDMQNFLKNAVATDTVPDILAWHELENSGKIVGDIANVTAIEKSLGISPRPIAIEEYAAPSEVGIPGPLVGYIAKFERLGIHDAELAFWNQSGALGDLLTGQGGSPNGAYWLYKWYADMSGQMVVTTPPAPTGIDGAASVTDDKKELDIVAGGASRSSAIRIDGLRKLAMGGHVEVKVEFTPGYGRTVPVAAPVTISDTTYRVGSDGSITVPVVMNAAYGYHVVVTPGRKSTSLAGTYTITNVNSGLTLDTAGSGTTEGTPVDQASATGGSTTQTWRLVDAGSGLYKIVNVANGLVLGVQNASTDNGAPAVIWSDSGTPDHLWQLIPDGKGHYRFANYGTGLVLGVTGMSKDTGAQVIQWTDGSPTSGCTATGPRRPGRLGKALSFCNSTAYATLPDGAVSGLTGDYTVSAWVDPAANAGWSRLFDIGTGSNASMFLTLNDGKELRYAITTSGAGGEQRINGTGLLPVDQWSLVTVTVSGTTGTLYVNGQVVGTNSAMTVHPSDLGKTTRSYIGKSQYGSDPALNATVDDFNVYSRALSASEVADLAGGKVGAGDVVHYAFDEAGGATLVDSSANGRNGTVVEGTTTVNSTSSDQATADHFWTLTPVLVPTATLKAGAAPVNGWYASNVRVSLTTDRTDGTIEYQVDGGAWQTYTVPFTIAEPGRHTVNDHLLSGNGIVDGSSGGFPVDIDTTAPDVSATRSPANGKGSPRNPVTVTFDATDTTSGVQAISYQVNGGAWKTVHAGEPVTFDTVGAYDLGYRATDNAGHVSGTKVATVRIADDPPTAVEIRPAKIVAGEDGSFTLTGFHRNTVVDLALGSTALGSVTTDVDGAAKATLRIPSGTPAGTYTVTATEKGGDLSTTASLNVTG
ncbi:RICIN domain-containing protein [Actinoallomurus rhizosphaericola]|uniref:RICIN domain-containing protein n=1 Tax=Actinoallomurus rhizosphaericola TaxID=2952536 RepID=UPI002092A400|nr:RICIN domain-containing protein [Actinoallomurus rhizosphaericola]MCO5995813.1 RICIN domain-containing protein [Actinoallomurus rhizosphaericola]